MIISAHDFFGPVSSYSSFVNALGLIFLEFASFKADRDENEDTMNILN